jgi:hypothetical protein
MYSLGGWDFGSSDNDEVCDFQLARNNLTAVSNKHFKVDTNPRTNRARLRVLSRNPIRVHVAQTERKRKRIVTIKHGETIDIDAAVTINLGEVTLRA